MNETQTNLREAVNEVVVMGVLAEKSLKEENVDGETVMSGYLTLKVDDINFVRFNCKQNMLVKDTRAENKLFTALQTVNNEYKTIAEVGDEAADRISVTRGSLNLYTAKNGKDVVGYKSSFFNRVVDMEHFEPKAEFKVEVFISSIVPEVDAEGNETGRLLIKGWVPGYNGAVNPITLTVPKEYAAAVERGYEPNQTACFWGDIVNNRVRISKEIPSLIGKPRIEYETKTKDELVVTGCTPSYGSADCYPEPYDVNTINAAIQERKNKLEENRRKASQSAPAVVAKPSGAARNRTLGF